mgnify:CR=1 FL=1
MPEEYYRLVREPPIDLFPDRQRVCLEQGPPVLDAERTGSGCVRAVAAVVVRYDGIAALVRAGREPCVAIGVFAEAMQKSVLLRSMRPIRAALATTET